MKIYRNSKLRYYDFTIYYDFITIYCDFIISGNWKVEHIAVVEISKMLKFTCMKDGEVLTLVKFNVLFTPIKVGDSVELAGWQNVQNRFNIIDIIKHFPVE